MIMNRKLNLGAGNTPLDGYENLDRKTGQEVYPLDYPDGCAAEIRASHVLEHFSHREINAVLTEWMRVLQPGGMLKIAVPDMQVICNTVAAGLPINAEGYLMGGHTDNNDHHGAAFTADTLARRFYEIGLERVRRWESDAEDCSSLPISLNLMGYKPAAEAGSTQFNGVTFVLPTARYGPSEHHRCVYDALNTFEGTRIRSVSGCFWHQHLSNAIEQEIAEPDCRYIITLDYDSLFCADDVKELYRIMETHPHIDALVPMQSHRGLQTPLFTKLGADGKPLSQVPTQAFDALTLEITTGHFGLTILRADKLRDLPRPWMQGRLAPDNTWGEGHTDPDIDFWYKWADAGNVVHLANHVIIGHIEDVVLWPGKDLAPIYQRVNDYVRFGKPKEARE